MSSKAKDAGTILRILQVYAPNMESQYEAFLEEVKVALEKATSSESLVLLCDFNGFSDIWVPDRTKGHQDKWVREIIVRDPFVLESFQCTCGHRQGNLERCYWALVAE